MKQSYIFEDIIVDVDDILPDPNKPVDDPAKPRAKKAWDSGKKENIWRGVDAKDVWTAEPDTQEKEPWDAGTTDADGQPNPPPPDAQDTQDNGGFGDIINF